ncbi:ankyrin repeat and zinc finger protein [Medicago truncatula]|uniref:Ankyrin repeat and zinc finger protein n=1 Tax=Medicago truncatula TaxID=3880 RepID=G7L0D7_MEDTR|nr:ankyrin repeat and zinc finger protein [Medicago truncatula]
MHYVKLTIAGKNTVKEEDFEDLTSDFVKDCDVSSISGSENDDDSVNESQGQSIIRGKSGESFKQKLFICLQTWQRVSLWKLKSVTVEPRDNTRLRIVLLASGRHFDGDTLVAHKTFHRYAVRAKAGKKTVRYRCFWQNDTF